MLRRVIGAVGFNLEDGAPVTIALVPLMTMPWMKYRCAAKNRITHGTIMMTVPAISRCSFGSPASMGEVWK